MKFEAATKVDMIGVTASSQLVPGQCILWLHTHSEHFAKVINLLNKQKFDNKTICPQVKMTSRKRVCNIRFGLLPHCVQGACSFNGWPGYPSLR